MAVTAKIKGVYATYIEYIQGLIDRLGGRVTAQDLVKDGRRQGSPLHDYFEWDDAAAGAAFRVEQAKYLLRHLEIGMKINDRTVLMRAFHSVVLAQEERQVYVTLERVLAETDLRDQVLKEAVREIRAWQAKYGHLADCAGIVKPAALRKLEAALTNGRS